VNLSVSSRLLRPNSSQISAIKASGTHKVAIQLAMATRFAASHVRRG
jgi:hypothetical protein